MQQNSEKQEYFFLSKLTDSEREVLEEKIKNSNFGKRYKENLQIPKNVWGILGGLAIGLVLFIICLKPPVKYWVIGIVGCVLLTIIERKIAYILEFGDEATFYVVNTCLLTFLLVGNIILRVVLGEPVYALVFKIFQVWLIFAFITNIIIALMYSYDLSEIWPNLVWLAIGVLLFFFWPWNYTWDTWQWIISIGGGILLTGLVVFLTYWLDEEQFIDPCDSLTVMLLLLSSANLVLLFTVGTKYIFICKCFMGILLIGSIVNIFLASNEDKKGLSILNFILTLINASVLLALFSGLYPQLLNTVEWVMEFFKDKQ